ncbi:MAG: hypothetical protein U0V73_00090 [Acidimicrobiia bacterium]
MIGFPPDVEAYATVIVPPASTLDGVTESVTGPAAVAGGDVVEEGADVPVVVGGSADTPATTPSRPRSSGPGSAT